MNKEVHMPLPPLKDRMNAAKHLLRAGEAKSGDNYYDSILKEMSSMTHKLIGEETRKILLEAAIEELVKRDGDFVHMMHEMSLADISRAVRTNILQITKAADFQNPFQWAQRYAAEQKTVRER